MDNCFVRRYGQMRTAKICENLKSMTTLLSDADVVERIFEHIDNKSTDTGSEVWREPVENYLSDERFEAELALMRRLPVAFCPSAGLPEVGSYIARRAAGIPLLVVRGNDTTWCNDDADGSLNPRVSAVLAPGEYEVYVGAYTEAEPVQYVLNTVTSERATIASGSGAASDHASGSTHDMRPKPPM